MLAGKCGTAGTVTETGVGIVTAVTAQVTRRTQTYIDIVMSENLLRQFEVDTLVCRNRRIKGIRPYRHVGDSVLTYHVPLRIIFGSLRIGQRPLCGE